MAGPRVLVTGGAGFVGSHAAKALAAAGYLPVAVDNLDRGHREFVRWGPLEVGNLLHADFVQAVFDKWRPEAVMHFAALAYVGESFEKPAEYFATNVTGTQNLLDACRRNRLAHLVFSSSCAVYGVPAALPVTESLPLQPISPYGWSKAAAEKIIDSFGAAYGLRAVSLRYFNAAGADPDGELWEWHEPETHLVPLAIRAATGAGPALNLFGTDYPTEDGTCIRDYIHVADLAAGHVAALHYLRDGGESTCINLGCGTGYSNRQVLDAVGSEIGRPVPARAAPRRPGDPPKLFANIDRAAKVLAWTPRLSDLTTIIRTAAHGLRQARTEGQIARM